MVGGSWGGERETRTGIGRGKMTEVLMSGRKNVNRQPQETGPPECTRGSVFCFAILWGPICRFSILQHKPLLFYSGISPLCPYLRGLKRLLSVELGQCCLAVREEEARQTDKVGAGSGVRGQGSGRNGPRKSKRTCTVIGFLQTSWPAFSRSAVRISYFKFLILLLLHFLS
jgi:hypothetical protein